MTKLLIVAAVIILGAAGYFAGTALATVSVGDNEYPTHEQEPFIFDPADPKNRDGICEEGFFLVGFINDPGNAFDGTEICAFNEFKCLHEECQNPDYYEDIVAPIVLEQNNIPQPADIATPQSPPTAEPFVGK